MTDRLLVFGAGYSASAIIETSRHRFETVWGTTRSPLKFAGIEALGAKPLLFDGENRDPGVIGAIAEATHILVSVAPGEAGDPVLSAFGGEIRAAPRLRWIGYLSTVGVYGDHDGAWVDEDTMPRPVSRRSRQRVEAELAWQEMAQAVSATFAVFRLSGIYGPGRNAFVNIEKGTSRRLVKPGQVFNRIHVADIARALDRAFELEAGGIFNITDDEPAPPQDVVALAHELAGIAPPPEQDFATAELSPMARSFYGENKRVANARSKEFLGLEYGYPDYRTALRRMWQEENWR